MNAGLFSWLRRSWLAMTLQGRLVAGYTALFAFLLGGVGLAWLAVRWAFSYTITGWEPIFCLGLFIIGVQLLSVGLLGELVAARTVREADTYSIADQVKAGSDEQEARSRTNFAS